MSVESVADRRRKRIVELILMYFDSAADAIRFGNTMHTLVEDRLGMPVKYRANVGAGDTSLAITQDYVGPVALKAIFLELPGDQAAQAICQTARHVLDTHNEVHNAQVVVADQVIREKPQPQVLGFDVRRNPPPVKLKLVR